MNKDRIAGKAKDGGGRIERQAGEWTGDPTKQVEGAAKQIEGKIQNAVGKVKDAVKKGKDSPKPPAKPSQRAADVESEEKEQRRNGA